MHPRPEYSLFNFSRIGSSLFAGNTPGSPIVDHKRLPKQLRKLEALPVEGLKGEVWARNPTWGASGLERSTATFGNACLEVLIQVRLPHWRLQPEALLRLELAERIGGSCWRLSRFRCASGSGVGACSAQSVVALS